MKHTFLIAFLILTVGSSFANSSKNEKNLECIQSMQIQNSNELSPFCKAIVKGDLETVQNLLALGVDVNEKSLGRTPAMYAARYNKIEILKLLIKYQANLKIRCTGKKFTALEYAQHANATQAAQLIEQALNS
jgi:ankyrin repeat protein